jgi:hypothetical protein
MDIAKVKDATIIKYGLEYKAEENRWITTLTTNEMECIDVCKKGTDKEVVCECEVSDTESVASLTDAEMDKLIRDASRKVLKVADKQDHKNAHLPYQSIYSDYIQSIYF